MSFPVKELADIDSINVSFTSGHSDSVLVDTLKYLFRRDEQSLSMFDFVIFCLPEIERVLVSENSEIVAFDETFKIKVFLDRLIVLQIVDVLVLFRDSEKTFLLVEHFHRALCLL
jgi:hypothetical protein